MSYLEKLNRFADNPVNMNMKRTKFRRNHNNTITFNSGLLIPILFDEVLPDDSISLDVASVVRSITPAVPVMDNSFLDIYAFFVPNRLATVGDKDWQQICGENINGFWANATEYTLENTGNTCSMKSGSDTVQPQSLGDYLGLFPVGFNAGDTTQFSRLPLNGYMLIWDEFFRDENLQSPSSWKTYNDNNARTGYKLASSVKPTCKLHDYFTSALPSLQKGASVLLPMAGSAPIKTSSSETVPYASGISAIKFNALDNTLPLGPAQIVSGGSLQTTSGTVVSGKSLYPTNLYADLALATAVSVNEMRQAFALQKLLEKDARGGTRYRSMLLTHFGVQLPDLTAQVPEYLGGVRVPMNMLQVLQTAQGTSPVGTTGAFSNTSDSSHLFTKSFAEFGMLYVLATVRTSQSYSQGINKFALKKRRFDWYYPVFANLGEQPIMESEIYADASTDWTEVFGYQEAWAEYRYKPNHVGGYCAAGSGDTVAQSWTYANQFAAKPVLNSSFIVQPREQVDNTLVITNATYQFIGNFYFDYRIWRAMPYFSIPGLIDHH